MPISCQFREFLSLINVQEHSFHQFQGLRRPREQSTLIIHFMRKLRIYLLFCPIGWFWLFYGGKAAKFGKLGVWLLDKNWATLKSPAAGKKANLLRFGALKFWQHCLSGVDKVQEQAALLPGWGKKTTKQNKKMRKSWH